MPKVLKLAMVFVGVLVLGSTVAVAQTTPPPGAGTDQTPASTHSKPRKGGNKKSGHKKGGKKKSPKKPPQ